MIAISLKCAQIIELSKTNRFWVEMVKMFFRKFIYGYQSPDNEMHSRLFGFGVRSVGQTTAAGS